MSPPIHPTLHPVLILLFAICSIGATPPTTTPSQQHQHPALFLIGDSLVKTGTNNGITGPWGWGYELAPMFDPSKIHVYNEALGGRSSRLYIEEGAWAHLLPDIQSGDYVLLHFGHNDAADSLNYPNRMTAKGNDDQTHEVISKITNHTTTVHTYGWYLRQYVNDAKSKGATIIICSPVPRNQWLNGKIKRGFDGYADWAHQAATQSNALFLPLNDLAATHYDALGEQNASQYFNDNQHTKKPGAHLNAESIVEGLKQLKSCPLSDALFPTPTEPRTK